MLGSQTTAPQTQPIVNDGGAELVTEQFSVQDNLLKVLKRIELMLKLFTDIDIKNTEVE